MKHSIEVNRYCECLYDIKQRIAVIEKYISKKSGQYRVIYVEYVCLQIRKILEGIALLSLVANVEEYAQQHERFATHYHARLIIRDLKRIAPDYFPIPVKMIEMQDGVKTWELINSPYLTEEKLIEIYEICGNVMHVQNPFSHNMNDFLENDKNFVEWVSLIKSLLNEHLMYLKGRNFILRGVMQSAENGHPQAYVLEKI